MRFRLSRAVYVVIFFVTFLILWYLVSQNNPQFTKTCELPLTFQNNLLNLSYRVHKVLDIMTLTHCLCYGALWGQVRRSSTLPWETNAEFCVNNKEISAFDENFIDRVFRKHNLTLVYDSAEGLYSVTDDAFQKGAQIQLIVFEEDLKLDVMRRVGWKRRMLPPNCEDSKSLECFPIRLLRKPLPMKPFGWKELPVPWESLEILKYHYPENWWKEVLPLNC
ncbi:hypothetical protein FOCC_FOCC005860 [Frankliniella occidentalis]|uniref:Uncharacterized protein LOC113215642 n=1 Tax=Frankliniella occidentalis TaxID=133901 RepID=A0A6J1TEB5_FRAOC|nr:uncharacterized protein LOC113215642 [Frankliniella occidentalis]KAE8747393.1 hypothetical protein FOCC_FOCC005860 [Frankliniella occidentalis]